MTRQRFGAAEELLATLPASVQRRNRALAPVAAVARRAPRKAPQRATAPVVALPPGAVVVTIDGLKLASEANARGHTKHGKSNRAAAVRAAVTRALQGRALPPLPLRVCVTRVAPRRIDTDNLASACKSARDQVAAVLGIDDGPGETRAVWRESQERGVYGVRITLTPLDGRGRVETTDVADVVRVEVSRDQVDTAVRTLLDRRGGWMGFDVAGLSLRVWIEAAK